MCVWWHTLTRTSYYPLDRFNLAFSLSLTPSLASISFFPFSLTLSPALSIQLSDMVFFLSDAMAFFAINGRCCFARRTELGVWKCVCLHIFDSFLHYFHALNKKNINNIIQPKHSIAIRFRLVELAKAYSKTHRKYSSKLYHASQSDRPSFKYWKIWLLCRWCFVVFLVFSLCSLALCLPFN